MNISHISTFTVLYIMHILGMQPNLPTRTCTKCWGPVRPKKCLHAATPESRARTRAWTQNLSFTTRLIERNTNLTWIVVRESSGPSGTSSTTAIQLCFGIGRTIYLYNFSTILLLLYYMTVQ